MAVVSDIAINKYLLKISPKRPEFRRGMLYAVNPVGLGSLLIAAGVSIAAFFGALGSAIRPYWPLVAIGLVLVLPPVIALDQGSVLPMDDELGNPSGDDYERPGHGRMLRARGAHLLAVHQHRQARGARPGRRPTARPEVTEVAYRAGMSGMPRRLPMM